MFIVSLAIADLIVGMIVMPISAIYILMHKWKFGIVICQFWICVDYTASTASILNLFILSLDRYWSISKPLKYLRKRTKKRALVMIFLVWSVSSLWLIPIVGWHYFASGGKRTVPSDVCDIEYASNTTLKIITAIFNFYLPLAIMYGLYGRIFMEIRRRSKFELGQRCGGGGGYHRSTAAPTVVPTTAIINKHVPPTGSMTDDSEARSADESDHCPENQFVIPSTRAERKLFITQQPSPAPTPSMIDYETEETSDEESRPNRRSGGGGYTNLALLRLNSSATTTSELSPTVPESRDKLTSPDDFKRMEYFYNESVIDSQTERVHRYFEEHPVFKTPPQRTRTAETSLSSPSTSKLLIGTPARTHRHHPPLTTTKNGSRIINVPGPAPKSSLIPKSSTASVRLNGRLADNANRARVGRRNKLSFARLLKIKGHESKNNGFNLDKSSSHVEFALKKRTQNLRKSLRTRKRNIRPSAALSKEIKAARQLGVIMGAFTVCFLPYFILFLVVAFCIGCVSTDLMTAMTWFGYINSTLNPFLYPLCNMTFRRKFRRMLGLEPEHSRVPSTFGREFKSFVGKPHVGYDSRYE